MTLPSSLRHCAFSARSFAMALARAAAVGGYGSGSGAVSSAVDRQAIPADSPVPRGSHDTRLKCLVSVVGTVPPVTNCSRKSVPGSPGPPGFSTTDPIGFRSVAGLRINARWMVCWFGSNQSSGTARVAHWKWRWQLVQCSDVLPVGVVPPVAGVVGGVAVRGTVVVHAATNTGASAIQSRARCFRTAIGIRLRCGSLGPTDATGMHHAVVAPSTRMSAPLR